MGEDPKHDAPDGAHHDIVLKIVYTAGGMVEDSKHRRPAVLTHSIVLSAGPSELPGPGQLHLWRQRRACTSRAAPGSGRATRD